MKLRDILGMLLFLLLFSCSGTIHLQPGQWLMNKNTIEIKSQLTLKSKNINADELLAIAQPAENKEVFTFLHHSLKKGIAIRPTLVIYDWLAGGRSTPLKWWIQHKIGEPYQLFDSTLVRKSANKMHGYLFNKGYFDASIQYKIERKKHHKVEVTYLVNPKTLYYISDLTWKAENDTIQELLNAKQSESLLKLKDPYDDNLIKGERERIELILRDKGYYDFSQEYVYFIVDTGLTVSKKNNTVVNNVITEFKHPLSIQVIVKNPNGSFHIPYHIGTVQIYPQHSVFDSLNKYNALDTLHYQRYTFNPKHFNWKAKTLTDKIYIEPGELYSLSNHQLTVSQLSGLGQFKRTDLLFARRDSNVGILDAAIFLVPRDRRDIGYELEVSTNTDFVGSGVNIIYHNYNLFRRADILSVTLKGALESPFENANNQLRTLDGGLQISEVFPQFLLPFKIKHNHKNQTPKSRITGNYNYLKRLNYYTQHQTSFSFGYEWNETKQKRHLLNPLTLNYTQYFEPSTEFEQLLAQNPLLKSSFQSRLIPGMNYVYQFNNQKSGRPFTNFYSLKTLIEAAGNSIFGVNQLINQWQGTPDQALKFAGINYSQYLKAEIDNKYTLYFSKRHYLVARMEAGMAYAYGYTNVLPFIKQFYSGGPNGLRGWRVRSIGPGGWFDSTANTLTLNQTGDVKLEGNLEYRFDIWGYVKGAVFVDAGNIWLLRRDSLRPNANFEFNKFYNQLAVAGGLGLRSDFDYFVIRFDIGVPIVSPYLPIGHKYLGGAIEPGSADWRKSALKYNLAIGYPF